MSVKPLTKAQPTDAVDKQVFNAEGSVGWTAAPAGGAVSNTE
jgi:hypothetical protein